MEIRFVQPQDRTLWFQLDRHLPADGFLEKVRTQTGYVLMDQGRLLGLLRYNLFWDSIPFCTLLYIAPDRQGQGLGRQLMEHWHRQMQAQGHRLVLTSTQVDEEAQHFYRKLGYRDCGGLLLDTPSCRQNMELFLLKELP